MHEATDPYAVLGLSPSADDVVVHAAWRALLRKYHPDTNPGDRAGLRAREINEAFAILGNPGARAVYDRARLDRARVALRWDTPRRDTAPLAPYFRPAPRHRPSITRIVGAMLLTLAIIPIAAVALLAYPDTAPATHDALARFGQVSPFAAELVARLDGLVPDTDTAPQPAPGTDSDHPEVATTG
ncbi:hypothetical protein GCM10009087_17480 [Sphingomonas oligophenolica]|uniref:J domain-containing protein n=1 Tax=Sphingomonas oligophenolica TaxID=301154 RepID=A0ABU9Y5P8_9SPHN